MAKPPTLEQRVRVVILAWLEDKKATIQHMTVEDYEDLVARVVTLVEEED